MNPFFEEARTEPIQLADVFRLIDEDPLLEDVLGRIQRYESSELMGEAGWYVSDIVTLSRRQIKTLLEHGLVQTVTEGGRGPTYRTTHGPMAIEAVLDEYKVARAERSAAAAAAAAPLQLSADQVAAFDALVASGADMVDHWAAQINPKIEGLAHVKRAALYCLASPGDQYGNRGRVHLLMHGDPGSAKSAIRTWIARQLGAVSCSQQTTKVGLLGSAAGAEITPGAVPRSHEGVCCIDELDKFPHGDRQGLLEAMEEGFVEIEAGGKSARFDAQARIIACANRTENFSPELLDRFDFKIFLAAPSGDDEKVVVRSILGSWFRPKPGYTGDELKLYLQYVRDYQPEIPDDVRAAGQAALDALIDVMQSAKKRAEKKMKDAVLEDEGSVRRREAVIRVAYTIAKLNHRPMQIGDFIRAIRELHPDLNGKLLEFIETEAGVRRA